MRKVLLTFASLTAFFRNTFYTYRVRRYGCGRENSLLNVRQVRLFNNPIVFRLVLLAGVCQLNACTSYFFGKYGPDGQSLDVFEKRVEAVFRLQNKMTSELMLLQDADTPEHNQIHEEIMNAEQTMQNKCSDLNEYASRDIDGLSKSLLLQRRVEQSVVACENAARLVETLIKTHQR